MSHLKVRNTNSQILIDVAEKLGIGIELINEENLELKLTKDGNTSISEKRIY